MAAELLQSPADTLDIVDGEVVIAGRKGGPSMSLGKIAAALGPSSKLRGDREPGLSAEGWFYADHQVYPYGNHLAVVKVDPDTGCVKVLRYVVAYDVGRALNPALVKGADRRRLRAGPRRRADGGVHLQRARRSAVLDLRRLSVADRARTCRTSRSC